MITVKVKDIELNFETKATLFSPEHGDKGTLIMLDIAEIQANDKILDLGCGYGLVGIYASKIAGPENVVMVDINETAVECAKENRILNGFSENAPCVFKSDGLTEVKDYDFTAIYSNPPYHTDFHVAKGFIENGFRHLRIGGRMVMVTKRRKWYENKLSSVFGGVKVYERDGYFVFVAEKREKKKTDNVLSSDKKNKNEIPQHLSKKLARKVNNRNHRLKSD